MQARIVEKGLFSCFEPDLTDADGEPVNVEISAVVWDGSRLLFGSDKNVPGDARSPVFALACDQNGRPLTDSLEFLTADAISGGRKYEDFALTADANHMLAATGFDRVADDGAGMDHYNRLLIWPCDSPQSARVVAACDNDGVRSSMVLRKDLEAALGAPYFKVEGLASLPATGDGDPRLLFGIRELGADHENFDYVCQVVAAPYRVTDDMLSFTGAFECIYSFDPSNWDEVRFTVGLSSLEYDPNNERLYFLTSFEVEDEDGNERIGAYMWALGLTAFLAGRPPALVHDHQGGVLEFANKAEGVAVLDNGRLFVVYDPDRAMELAADHPRDRRRPHEAPYTLLEISVADA